MSFFDVLRLALRNLRESKLRSALTTMGVTVGVAVIVTMVSFGLGLQRNTLERFKQLDLLNEITVYGRNLAVLLNAQQDGDSSRQANANNNGGNRRERSSKRNLDDQALDEIAAIQGVAYVEPNVSFTAYVRANGRVRRQSVGGARVPNAASRFQTFAVGQMFTANDANASDIVVDETFVKNFGYEKAEDTFGQTVELLAPKSTEQVNDERRQNQTTGTNKDANKETEAKEDEGMTFFGLPLEEEKSEEQKTADATRDLIARPFKIVGVLKNEQGNSTNGTPMRIINGASNLYVPLAVARNWSGTNRSSLDMVALELARASGAIRPGETEGYNSATVRVSDPTLAPAVSKRLDEMGFNNFGLFSQLEQIRTFFLIIQSALGLLGGISLLVASLGIANTMIMSILERTREIGIMKAIGAEDREIKLIFFVEAAVIGFAGGVIGVLIAWAITALSNTLAFQFILKPQGASYVDFFSLPPYLWLGAILFAITISILAALYPAARAAAIDPVKALRHD